MGCKTVCNCGLASMHDTNFPYYYLAIKDKESLAAITFLVSLYGEIIQRNGQNWTVGISFRSKYQVDYQPMQPPAIKNYKCTIF